MSSPLAPEDFDAAIAEKDHARDVGDEHKVRKFWEPELDELARSDSLANSGVDTQAQTDARKRADEEFRQALSRHCSELLRGCGFVRIRISSESVDGDSDGWREVCYVVTAFDTESRRYDMRVERPSKPNLGIEYTRECLQGLGDQIAARLVTTRDEYLRRMRGGQNATVLPS